ncbi:MAG: DUF3127 domain-containing protein [Bacteroidetes bacterium]|nr:MAG: DUF3127 domain-containing protein [Bacteroidota bacterium]
MEIKGRLIEILEPKTGKSSRGDWKKQDFVIETDEQFPKKICISNWNDKADLSSIKPGDILTVKVNIESREYNGNWYTDVKVWQLESENKESVEGSDLPGLGEAESAPPWDPEPENPDEDLPF